MKHPIQIISLLFLINFSTISGQLSFDWVKTAGAGSTWADIGRAIAVDDDNNIIIGGQIAGNAQFDHITINTIDHQDFFVAKYDMNGDVLWVHGGGSDEPGAHGYDFVDDVEIDPNGNIYISGYIARNATFQSQEFQPGKGAFICKMDPDGNLLWMNSYVTSYTEYSERGKGVIECDNMGNVYFATNFIDQIDLKDTLLVFDNFPGQKNSNNIITIKFDAEGNRLWFKTGYGIAANIVEAINVDDDNNVVVYGSCFWSLDFGNGPLNGDNWLVKYSSDGSLIWSLNPPQLFSENAKGMDIDEEGNILVLERIGAATVGIKKLAPDGDHIWGRFIAESSFLVPKEISCQNDTCYITGWFEGTLSTDISDLTAQGKKDIFLIVFNSEDGKIIQSLQAGSAAEFPLGYYDSGYDVFKNDEGLFLAGSYKGAANFGDIENQAQGSASDIFFAKLSYKNITNVKESFVSKTILYPNPTTEVLNIQLTNLEDDIADISLLTVNGHKVNVPVINSKNKIAQIDVSHLNSGTYILQIKTQAGQEISEKVFISR